VDRSRKVLLALAGLCAGLFVVLLGVAYWTGFGRWLDGAALQGFVALQRPAVESVGRVVAHSVDPLPYALAGGALVWLAAARRGRRLAVAIAALLAGSAVTSQVLKPALAHARFEGFLGEAQIGAAAFPSGHATAAMALALAAVIVAPAVWRRPVAVVAGAFALAVSFSIVTLGWHFPSDVLGGHLVAAGWAFGVMAAVRPAAPGVRRCAEALPVAAATGSAGAVAAAAASGFAERHTAAVAVAIGISAAAALLLAAVTAALRS
jgi:membrane-associated phospholipid phosphatase